MITKWWSLNDFQDLPQESLIRLWYHHFLDTHRRYYDVSMVNGTVAFLLKPAYVPSTVYRTRRPVFTVASDVYNKLLAPSELFGRVTFRAGRWDGCFRSHHVSTYVQLGCHVDPVALFMFLSEMYDVEHLAFIMTRHDPSGVCECCGERAALVEHHWWSSEEERE